MQTGFVSTWQVFFFYQNIDYNVKTNNLKLTKMNQNNMIKMSQAINITLQPMQQRLSGKNKREEIKLIMTIIMIYMIIIILVIKIN